MQFNCAYTELVSVSKLVPNPKNANKHSAEQIERLAKIIDFQGQRSPIVVSKRSGFITKGHGRLMAMQKLGWENVAVDYQDYLSEAQEYADVIADNEIARWAELDKELVLKEMKVLDLGDFDLLGLKDFNILEPIIENEKEIEINFNYKIEIDCSNEDAQKNLSQELEDRGFKVRLLI